ncbi:ABC transporter substrate-binding protein [Bradyrhizobium sp. ARR65]|uniref:ABC transporter substrate-binding protein n=1 Tax=Bradyrhizobium sp. ARR65 TaxID=1040989 RepID=UPI0004642506|nr:ABC transporter substrate-binding protein [Bradyrhizobium sp. ARR65]
MTGYASDITQARSSRWPARWATALFSALLATAASAAPADNINVVRDLASRVGPIIGSALACPDIAQYRILTAANKFRAVIKEASPNDSDREDLARLFDRYVSDGRAAVTTGKINCGVAERQLADLEQSISTPSSAPAGSSAASALSGVIASAAAATAPTAPLPQPVTSTARGVTDREIRFGIVGPFSGASRELGRQMKLGIDTAFSRINDAGGVDGRTLRLIAADDGYEPARTLAAMKQLYEKDQVFAYIGNVGTPTAAVAVPYALEHRTLFFGAFTGANILRNDPPDRYVFNYRASYAEETDAVVRYLLKIRRLQPRQIAVFAQQDAYGDAGFAGVAKAFRSLGLNDGAIVRLNYKRNTVDVDEAVNLLRVQKPAIKAVVMVATYRAAAKFIEKTRDLYPGMVYTNVSFVGSTELADELMLLGPRFASGVIVTQVVPAVGGYSSAVLEYKNALAKYFPGEAPDYVSFEGYVAANVLIQGIKRAGPQFDTEKLIDTLENMRNLDLGLGAALNFGRAEHQASHKIWGTAIDENGKYQPVELE